MTDDSARSVRRSSREWNRRPQPRLKGSIPAEGNAGGWTQLSPRKTRILADAEQGFTNDRVLMHGYFAHARRAEGRMLARFSCYPPAT